MAGAGWTDALDEAPSCWMPILFKLSIVSFRALGRAPSRARSADQTAGLLVGEALQLRGQAQDPLNILLLEERAYVGGAGLQLGDVFDVGITNNTRSLSSTPF